MLLSIEPGSPADQAGLQLGDILVSLDGKPVGDIDDLQTALRGDAVGRTVKAVLIRGGEMIEAQIAISERPKKAR
ncbi:MAG: PDZ domain-containing protein [Acidobacteriaceae bacterium]|nr:PDZ domain-containing protein [Acidobacteriaceae bacterium]